MQIEFVVLGALQATLLALFFIKHTEHRALFVTSTALQLCSAITLGLLSHCEHRNTIRPPISISVYLIFTSILDAARARTQALIPGQTIVASILIAAVAVKVFALVIETREKSYALLPEYSELSSELRGNIFSRAFFLWLNPLLLMGFRSIISSQDLAPIHEKLSSEMLTARVRPNWIRSESIAGEIL
jgi:ATP-binding cassette subfamily C (CFTR/MRP) protein 1